MLSCSCPEDWDGESGWCYYPPDDFTVLKTKRARRCSSCHTLIKVGAECLEFIREAACKHEIEESIYGDTKPIASMYVCGDCSEIWLNLTDVGYCISPDQDMRECLNEYHQLTGFKKEA